jgi:nucleotide-binding universal stress UspA family protein
MSIKDLVVTLDSSGAARVRLRLASDLARRFGAHLIGLYPLPVRAAVSFPIYFEGALLEAAMREAEKKADYLAAEVRALFEETARRDGVSAEWRTGPGFPSEDAATSSRYADLTIVGQPDPEMPGASLLVPLPEDVALAAGRPVLVIPYAGDYKTVGRRALIAWNASREATRAVADAMPLLSGAERVTILAARPRKGPKGHGDVPGADIAMHLARHGIRAEVEQTEASDIDVGNLLLSHAADLDADLLVMGAYGHSRGRELLVGGVTRTILRSMTLPVLLSH